MSVLGSSIQAAGNLGAAAISSGTNVTTQKLANETNLKMNEENNLTNLQLAKEQQAFDRKQWEDTNTYNSPEEQNKRMIAAGINPLTAFGSVSGSTGNAAGPVKSPDMAIMNAGHIDPITMDDTLLQAFNNATQAEISKYNNETARMKAESDIEFNAASTKNVMKATEQIEQNMEYAGIMLPYTIKESIARTNDTNASAKNKEANTQYIKVSTDKVNAEIFKTYEEVEMGWMNVAIDQQNADTNQMNAETNRMNAETQRESVRNNYDIALKQLDQMELGQFMTFAEHFVTTENENITNSLNWQKGWNTNTSAGMTIGAGIAGGGSFSQSLGFNGQNGGQDTNTKGNTSQRIDLDAAMKEYAKLCAMGTRLTKICQNAAIPQKTRQKAVDLMEKVRSRANNEQTTLNHRIRTDAIKNGLRTRKLLQGDASGLGNPLNGTSF